MAENGTEIVKEWFQNDPELYSMALNRKLDPTIFQERPNMVAKSLQIMLRRSHNCCQIVLKWSQILFNGIE